MIKINNTVFYDMSESCGSCSFFCNGVTNVQNCSERGHCCLFDKCTTDGLKRLEGA